MQCVRWNKIVDYLNGLVSKRTNYTTKLYFYHIGHCVPGSNLIN